jgi:uncharacterized protein involved in exopolysaccharide biosynthesis
MIASSVHRMAERTQVLQVPPVHSVYSRSDEPLRTDLEWWQFTSYVTAHWRVVAIACGLAVFAVVIISLLLPKKYTATASVLIEPPAGNDPRGSIAVSPVYLESLKTYEHFALSDSLFQKAMNALDLRRYYAGVPIETVKNRILDVSKPRDTKVLQIKATLPDPVKARNMAQFIARQTVDMNHALGQASVSELTEGGDAVLATAKRRLDNAMAARVAGLAQEPTAELESQVASANELKSYIGRELVLARTESAAYESRTGGGKQGPAYMDTETAKEAAAAAHAQLASLTAQMASLDSELTAKSKLLEQRKHHRELLEKELLIAQQGFETAMTHRNEVLESVSFRGERLEIIDPGVVPEKPSSPNIPLNVGIAAAGSLLGSLVYLSMAYGYQRRRFLSSYSERS